MTEIQTPIPGTEQAPAAPAPAENPVNPNPAPELPGNPPAPAPAIDYEEKFRQSSAEANRLREENRVKDAQLQQINNSNPTDAELRAEYPTADLTDPLTRKMLEEQLATKKWRQQQELRTAEAEAERRWQADLNALVAKPEYESLRGDKDFEAFANKHPKGTSLDVLADSFIVRKGKVPTAPPPENLPTAPSGNEALPAGSGGPREPGKTGYTAEEVAEIRKNDPKRYQELVTSGQIKIDI